MAQRRQRGWLKKESRIQGETWVPYFRITRKSDGRRVENNIPIGLVRDLPDKVSAWAEVERLHLRPAAAKAGILSSHRDEQGRLVEDDPRRYARKRESV